MCRLVGIYGEKGSGRKTAAWLLAKTMEEQIKNTPKEDYNTLFQSWVDEVCQDENIIESTHHVIVDSFGDSILDTLKIFNPNLQGYNLHDDYVKSCMWVQLTTGKVVSEEPIQIISPEQAVDLDKIKDTYYMTIRDYILYWADWVIKKRFGENIWIHLLASTNELMNSKDHRIYWDVRTQGEIDYIQQSGGILIHLINQDRHKLSGYRKIYSLGQNVITMNTQEGLRNAGHLFWQVSEIIRGK